MSTNFRTLTRKGIDLICAMQGYNYMYYIDKIEEPIEKCCMSTSMFVTRLYQNFQEHYHKEHGCDEEDSYELKWVWMFYRCSRTKNVKAIQLNKK